jgi:hypothetical protein
MDWQASIPFVAAAVIGGAVTWALCSLLPSVWRASRWPLAIAVALICGLIGPRLMPALTPPNEIERQLLQGEEGELSAAWKEADPESFAAYVEDIRAAYAGSNRQAALERARAGVANAARSRMPNLSDEQLVDYLHVQRDIFIRLEVDGAEFCRPIYFAEPLPSSGLKVDPVLSDRQRAIFAAAFRADPQAGASLSGEAYETALGTVLQETEAVLGDDYTLLARESSVDGHEVEFCAAAAEMFNELAASPEAGPLYRAMLRASQ